MENINISSFLSLVKPNNLKNKYPITDKIKNMIINTRIEISNIIKGDSDKKLFIVGPCSIHNIKEALIYAKQLKHLADMVSDKILIVMRVYFEKPRTTIGWKGLINDPDLDNTFHVNKGLELARKLLIDINTLGLPCGYEVLDTITPQYISDLISWGAVGARTTESQVHRQMVSGLSMPVGFKNGTSGNMIIARDAVISATFPHCFMGITNGGEPSICKTKGNKNCHVILRGGSDGPNFELVYIKEFEKLLKDKNLNSAIMVDCSHGNSYKDYTNQHLVLDITIQNMTKNDSIIGVMIESNLYEGNQQLTRDNYLLLKEGISITDSCIGFVETMRIIKKAYFILNKFNGNNYQDSSTDLY